ncbi:HAD-IIB family hydrolase [uncultured Peptoniphilus sp.]|uniref:HAD-IIB family hydrolase n=1 Tax=uncultured Peptoniphilus sp. TaxID=254354 RepID=UPI0025EA07CE|nr:HAD family hydrolase [uncultured Peptoniphilus sp.]
MIKMLSMDLDETLLSTDKVMTESFRPFVEKLRANNIIPVVATGREFHTAHRFVGEDLEIDLICNNGNIIKNNKTGELEFVNPMSKEDVDLIMSFDKNDKVYSTIHVEREDGIDLLYKKKNFKSFEGVYVDAFRGRNLGLDNFDDYEGYPLSIVFAGSHDDLIELRSLIKEGIGEDKDKFNFHLMKIKREPKWMLEILQKNGDKFFGIKKYAENRNIKLEEVAAIGDDSNDKMLVENVGLGFAMINAVDILKEVADVVSDYDNNNDGAIKILDKVLFGD